ncbi:MAG: carbohydrate-binding family 9-like protein [Mangrovibacterium sp.]|nr:carbohydrate-binding family 9-like protein [Mangrovibacterium sp.]
MNSLSEKGRATLDLQDFEAHPIECVNWKEYPYKPEVQFKITNDEHLIYLQFNVKEKYIRAVETVVNGNVYQDSCVEFFISPRADGKYYNFEFSCIGIPHVAYGPDRYQRMMLPIEIIEQMRVKSSLGTEPFEEKKGDIAWKLNVEIPITCFIHDNLKSFEGLRARANFYKCGDATSEPHYLSWSPIETVKPDFHQYPFFGNLLFI